MDSSVIAINDLHDDAHADPATSEPRDATRAERLTRAQVAGRLGISVSSVRRLEGAELHPEIGADGVRRFDPAEVSALAADVLARAPARAGRKSKNAVPSATALPRGELAARVFERLDERQSLAEIVIGLRVAPEVVRDLHREWLVGLVDGELSHPRPRVPIGTQRHGRERSVDDATFAALLAALPVGTPTRISVARDLGDYFVGEDDARRVAELGGIVVTGPIDVMNLVQRYGAGDVRVTAYAMEPRGFLWEVFTSLPRTSAPDVGRTRSPSERGGNLGA